MTIAAARPLRLVHSSTPRASVVRDVDSMPERRDGLVFRGIFFASLLVLPFWGGLISLSASLPDDGDAFGAISFAITDTCPLG
jgi:hypothetical protein